MQHAPTGKSWDLSNRPTRSCSWQPQYRHPGVPLVQYACWYDVLRCCLGEVVTFLGRHDTESVQFQQVVDFLESGCVDFSCPFRQLIIHHTTLVFGSGCHPERLCLAIEHSHSFDCLKRRRVWFCHGVDTPVHDCLHFRIELGFSRKNCQIIAGADTNGNERGIEDAAPSGLFPGTSSGVWSRSRRVCVVG